eukprot:CAMPEP_0182417154 /NCGR_PEP_ID=MMETSP1167-20130531/1564_1 /TAXON_ID=2988 /ORGANISM="Mallomonas Sp, Strain CCMP3275" /LENGTH=175 /DNA_ID=CAMNT_0024590493 /DNA_START=150 /DNA_END=674 /DNA_ORIENTATION=-
MSMNYDNEGSARRSIPEVDKIDFKKLSPIYGLQPSGSSEPEYLKYNEKGRDITGKMFFNTGVAWLGGFACAGAYGFVEGWRGAANPSYRIKLNSVINAVSKRGAKAGNAMGSIAFLYTVSIWATEFFDVEGYVGHGAAVPVVSGLATGLFYKSASGVRGASLAGAIGTLASVTVW